MKTNLQPTSGAHADLAAFVAQALLPAASTLV